MIPPATDADLAANLERMYVCSNLLIDPGGEIIRRLIRRCCSDEKDVESLNRMLRESGQGQGSIDAQCEELDKLRAEVMEVLEPFASIRTNENYPDNTQAALAVPDIAWLTAGAFRRAAELLKKLKEVKT